jgi:glycosyltransferase involved in cell wall biosynthesis
MHIIENYFDACGFDHRLVQGGTSIYLWNMSRSFAAQGHRVSVVTPAHGQLEHIRALYPVQRLPYVDEYELTIPLDPAVWPQFGDSVSWKLRTTAHHLRLDGVDIYLLSNELLDQLPDTFYPAYEDKGRDPVYFKPVAFQVDSIRFIRQHFAGERAVIHAHEPYYHYLLPAAFREDPDKLVVSVVQSNMPITKMVYRPKVERLLQSLNVAVELPPRQEPLTDPLAVTMSQYQQLTHLHYEYPPDYVPFFALVAEHADLVDFLSPGQLEFYSTFADTPFEQLFKRLPIARTVARNAHKFFVGGCALADRWMTFDRSTVDRDAVLRELGLQPGLTTFFHNARYAVHHKGQVELMRAVDQVLTEGLPANFIIRCLSGRGIDNEYFHDVVARHRGRVYLEWERVCEDRIASYAASSDFCVFPSKFEMDTFLIAQGEAMACGAVPIATAQLGMAHYGHVADPVSGPGWETATGFAVNRSFAEDDSALVAALVDRMRRAVTIRTEQPDVYRRLSANAIATARRFSWSRCTQQHLDAFQECYDGQRRALPIEDILARGWFDLLPDSAWSEYREQIAARALAVGDVDVFRRVGELTAAKAQELFDAAYARADFAACARVASLMPDSPPAGWSAVRDRWAVSELAPPQEGWRLHYRVPQAERVQLVRPAPPGPGRGKPSVIPLARDLDGFTADIAGARPTGELHLLVTLASGRVVWDRVGGE